MSIVCVRRISVSVGWVGLVISVAEDGLAVALSSLLAVALGNAGPCGAE